MMGWYGNGGWGAGMAFMGLFWVVLITLAVWAVLRFTRRPDEQEGRGRSESARQILDRRFAAGQIDAEQYAEARRVLDGRSLDDAPR